MKKILVTGGAGYIGSAAVRALIKKKYDVIVVDNLSKGVRSLVDKKAQFYEADLADAEELGKVFSKNKFYAVMHFAAYKNVGESMTNAAKYSDNITGTINLLNMMVRHKVNRLVYSSSAAVYGIPEMMPVDEEHKTEPINYYGYTKLETENIIKWYSKIHGIRHVLLRYFNVAGDCGLNYIDPDAQNIMPILMEVVTGRREKLVIYGNDYPTRDGTCVRDYIDVNDLIDAHISSLDVDSNETINLGTSVGVTVMELVNAAVKVTKQKLDFEIGSRREGDPPALVASNRKAQRVLGWKPKKDIRDMIRETYISYVGNE